MIDKLKAFIEDQQNKIGEQHKQTATFQTKLEGAFEFCENVLKPFVVELEKDESNTVSEETSKAE